MAKRKIWRGSYYLRGGKTTDKHKNVYQKPITYRQKKTGIVVNPKARFITIEPPYKHHYGFDRPIRKVKKPKGWHGESARHSLARRGIPTGRRR